MANSRISFRDRFISALLIGGVIGILMGSAVKMFYTPVKTVTKEMKTAVEKKKNIYRGQNLNIDEIKVLEKHPVMLYVRAYQEGKWDEIVEQTQWIQERIKFISNNGDNKQEKIINEKKEIIKKIQDRNINKNYLTKEGVDDQYIFLPEAKINIIGIDDKGPFIDKRIKETVFLNVEYTKPSKALRNEQQIPIKFLVCSLSVNSEGKIVKSSIIGNAKIEYSSIKLWYLTKGEK